MIFEKTAKDFCKEVEEYVLKNEVEYMEAVIDLCDKYGVEPQAAAKHLTKPIKEKIQMEGVKNNMMKAESNKLPL